MAPGRRRGAAPAVLHLLSHAAFKALLFLVAGCVAHLVGSTLLRDMGGLRATHPPLAVLLAARAGRARRPAAVVRLLVEGGRALGGRGRGTGTLGWPAQLVLAAVC